jgi:hypothetical protein
MIAGMSGVVHSIGRASARHRHPLIGLPKIGIEG